MPLFFIFILVPLIELYILLEVGAIIGSGWTFLIIIATAVIGTRLVRQQGLSTWNQIQQELAQGKLPAQSLFDGICILISGVLLITPGFMTDILGLLLLTPVFRATTYKHLGNKIRIVGRSAYTQEHSFEAHEHKTNKETQHHNPTTLDGEFTRKD